MTKPPPTPHDPDIIAQRRARVAQLKLRALSTREIALALARGDSPIVNPHTGQPYDHATIVRDLEFLQAEWQQQRIENTDTDKVRQFMEMQEIKRAGWGDRNPELVRRTLRDEVDLLGTAKAKELNINFNFDIDIVMRLADAIEARGESPSQWFLEMLQDMADADSNSS